MPFHVTSIHPNTALSVFAQLYGCSEQDFHSTVEQMTHGWLVQNSEQDTLGVIGLRSSPAHGAELMGGAFPGPDQHEAALALVQAVLAIQPHVYGYAEPGFLPEAALAVGLHPVSAYTRMVGPVLERSPVIPEGFRIVPLADVSERADRLIAQRTYSDRIGHTHVPDEAADANFAGSDDRLSRVAYGADGVPMGICRVTVTDRQVALGTPGVAASARGCGLRRALLLSAVEAAREAGATELVLEGWGDTPAERAEDAALGLTLDAMIPIYSSVPLS